MSGSLVNLKASFHTLGCKLNFAESSTFGRQLAERGVVRTLPGETPDIIVVNTCSVTHMADKKSRQLIRQLRKNWPEATIVATGCYVQLNPDEAASIEGVDIVFGNNEKGRIVDYLDRWMEERRQLCEVSKYADINSFSHACERGDRTRWFLKVQDGCDYFCSYCTIPKARGRSRSPRISELVEEARKVADLGGREIVITGVNVGDFGNGTDEKFFDLIRTLDGVEGIERFRISSIEPNLLTPEIIRFVASESRAFMPHFHIPLQAGSDNVLKLMRRRYDTSLFASRIEMIRNLIPDAFIGVDVIAGARGETPQEWEKGLKFIEGLDVTKLHVFPYSERPGTAALALADNVPVEERHRRVGVLNALSEKKLHEFMEKSIGSVRPVLWEEPRPGMMMHGFTDNYIRVSAEPNESLVNTIGNAKIVGFDADGESMLAKPVDKP